MAWVSNVFRSFFFFPLLLLFDSISFDGTACLGLPCLVMRRSHLIWLEWVSTLLSIPWNKMWLKLQKEKKTPKIEKKKISTENSNGGNDFYTFFVQSCLLLMKRFNEGQSTKILLLIFGGEWIHVVCLLFDCLSIAFFLYFDCEISRVERSSSLMASIQCLKSQVICELIEIVIPEKCYLR